MSVCIVWSFPVSRPAICTGFFHTVDFHPLASIVLSESVGLPPIFRSLTTLPEGPQLHNNVSLRIQESAKLQHKYCIASLKSIAFSWLMLAAPRGRQCVVVTQRNVPYHLVCRVEHGEGLVSIFVLAQYTVCRYVDYMLLLCEPECVSNRHYLSIDCCGGRKPVSCTCSKDTWWMPVSMKVIRLSYGPYGNFTCGPFCGPKVPCPQYASKV